MHWQGSVQDDTMSCYGQIDILASQSVGFRVVAISAQNID